MAPIRIGFIGLSAAATGTGWAETAHLTHLRNHPERFKITALLNRSVENGKAAIEKFNLGPETQAYSDPQDLANDPNVDLVVCSNRVDLHYKTLLPVVKAGKNVFSEWPLGANLAEAKELADASRSVGIRTMVGLQGHLSPYVNKVKELVDTGRIGKVLNTAFFETGGNFGGRPAALGVKYMTDKKVGGNLLTIWCGHAIDSVLYALSSELSTFQSYLGNQRPNTQIINKSTGEIVDTVVKNTPDLILLNGRLDNGAILSYHLRGGPPTPGMSAIVWRVYGETGEIVVTQKSNNGIGIGSDDLEISLHEFSTDKLEKIAVDEGEYKKLPLFGRNVARLYDAFAEGKRVPDWEWAKRRHALIEEMFEREETGSQDVAANYVNVE